MLCEGRLLSMTYWEMEEDLLPPQKTFQIAGGPPRTSFTSTTSRPSPLIYPSSLKVTAETETLRASADLKIPPLLTSHVQALYTKRQTSAEMEIPAQAYSDSGDTPFLVPSCCQSIYENYSDLHIGGEQVLPLVTSEADFNVYADVQPVRPFLHSCDVPPAVEDSPPGQRGLQNLLRRGSNHWRQTSGRDRSFLFQGREGPFSNSLLNHYLEQKLLDLYQQYMIENMVRDGAPGSDGDVGNICPLLGSELVLTSLDQITQQLSREGNLEAGLAKDMVLSCLLRVASDLQSGEISTPFLQISNEASREQLTESKQE
ncbi:TLR adapter interacting with SLC15A4 on the lysosome [Cyprinodon tularosa]|uniref:TLR adapter interacting with SLC15A4 on the lysosome n=1 Tax=Cyprinodon tularosa TaxID=77115 RepID=UPI0018E1FA7A|nr:TLR adapter interacting with SLC15A4 on the lysosome [Cyprinodon tularosa]